MRQSAEETTHCYDQCDHSSVKQVLYCQTEDQPVSRNELVKGYEYELEHIAGKGTVGH